VVDRVDFLSRGKDAASTLSGTVMRGRGIPAACKRSAGRPIPLSDLWPL